MSITAGRVLLSIRLRRQPGTSTPKKNYMIDFRPDFDFSSLIVGPQYSDHRRGYRSVHSFDEVRDPSLMGYGYGNRLVDNYWNRRTHSYDSPHFGVQNGSAYFYQNNGAQSFEVPGYHQNQADRSAILRVGTI